MENYRIVVLIGSLRKESYNRKLAEAIYRLAPSELTFLEGVISDLPLYNQDDDGDPAASVKRLKSLIFDAAGLLFVTPEYNRSMPGVLKNAIDHASRPYGESAWKGKPAGILGISPGDSGTAMAQQHLRNVLSCLEVATMCQPEGFFHATENYFGKDGLPAGENLDMLNKWLESYAEWIEKNSSKGTSR